MQVFQPSCGLSRGNNSGIALIIVISVLAIAGVMAVSFAFTQRLELKAALNYQLSVKAGYLAEAGVRHAMQLLKEEKWANAYDDYRESWTAVFQGGDVDNDEDGNADSRWIDFVDEGGGFTGRYAVRIIDEAGKLNLNSAGFHNTSPLKVTDGWTPFEVSLEKFLDAMGVANAKSLAESVLDYRYGGEKGLKNNRRGMDDDLDGLTDETGYPGTDDPSVDDNNNARILAYDGIDNDADGIRDEADEGINEPIEFDPQNPYGDDRVFLSVEQLKDVAGVSEEIFQNLRRFLGTSSADKELNSYQRLRLNLHQASADQLYKVFRDRGVGDPARKAVRLKDWLDPDFGRSSLVKVVRELRISDEGTKGDWRWEGGYYVNKVPGGIPGGWRWIGIEPGNYYLSLFAREGSEVIGDVTVGGQTAYNVEHGDQFVTSLSSSVTVGSDGVLSLQIQNNRRGAETECHFERIQLEPLDGIPPGFPAVSVHGVEPIRINELMVSPVIELGASQGQNPGGHWVWQGSAFANNHPQGGTAGEGTWEWKGLMDGTYYVDIFGTVAGEMAGDVQIRGRTKTHMKSGDRFPSTVTVSGGTLRVEIQNNEEEGECIFARIRLSQQPDSEFIELVNIGQDPVNVGAWVVEGPGPEGWPATIPIETDPIPPSGYLVLAVDLNDTQEGVSGNGISLKKRWSGVTNAVQFQFEHAVSETGDLLRDSIPQVVRLKNEKGQIVDEVEYLMQGSNVSLEGADPADDLDSSLNGIRDGFYTSQGEKGGTPGGVNQNGAMIKEYDEFNKPIYHDVHKEIWIRNRAIPNLGLLSEVPLGTWSHWKVQDLARVVDDITLGAIRLEAEGHAQGLSGWSEVQQAAPLTHVFRSPQPDEIGEWKWDEKDQLKNGYYFLRLYGEPDQGIQISLRLADETWTEFTPGLTPGSDGGVSYGVIAIGTGKPGSTPVKSLSLRLRNASSAGIATFDYLTLEPIPQVAGRINVNTAGVEVLQSLPDMDSILAGRIAEGRPYGDKEGLKRGVGDLITSGALGEDLNSAFVTFGKIANLITVRSDHFEIIATGQWVRKGTVQAEKRIRVVVER